MCKRTNSDFAFCMKFIYILIGKKKTQLDKTSFVAEMYISIAHTWDDQHMDIKW